MVSKTRVFPDEPEFRLNADGAISNARLERFALFLVDEVPAPTAWKLLGGRTEGGSAQYRRKVEAHPLFIQRLATLKAEKEELMADDLFGEAKFMAKQLWREARATGNATMAQKALDARMKIMEREDARRPADSPQDGVRTQGRPGKPATENPQAGAGMEAIKAKLMEAGAPVPGAPRDPVPADLPAVVAFLPEAANFDAQLDRLIR